MIFALILACFLLMAPATLYPAYTGMRGKSWDRAVVRDTDGVRAGAQAFEVGEG